MSPDRFAPRCSARNIDCPPTSSGTVSATRYRPEAPARGAFRRRLRLAAALAGLVTAAAAPAQPSLIEAARENRERIRAHRERHGAAVAYRDEDLPAGADRGDASAPEPAPDPGAAGAAEAEAGIPPGIPPGEETDPAERVVELRRRLLEVEASLTAVGASGLPYAVRDPNRFRSGFDAAPLRAEREAIREELRELERRAAGREGGAPSPGPGR